MLHYNRITFHYLWSQRAGPTVQLGIANGDSTHRVKMPVIPEVFVPLINFPLLRTILSLPYSVIKSPTSRAWSLLPRKNLVACCQFPSRPHQLVSFPPGRKTHKWDIRGPTVMRPHECPIPEELYRHFPSSRDSNAASPNVLTLCQPRSWEPEFIPKLRCSSWQH